jgi:hypothetical protein
MLANIQILNIQDIEAARFTDGSCACSIAFTVSHAVRFIRASSTYVVHTLVNTGNRRMDCSAPFIEANQVHAATPYNFPSP